MKARSLMYPGILGLLATPMLAGLGNLFPSLPPPKRRACPAQDPKDAEEQLAAAAIKRQRRALRGAS